MAFDQKTEVNSPHSSSTKVRLLGIFVLLCLITPFATTYVFLKLQKKQIKKEIKWKMIAGLDRDELVLLKFTKEEAQRKLHWEHSKEFEYNGEMYDIAHNSTKGDSIFYWCWWDHKETKLNRQLKELVAFALGNNQQRKNNQEQLADFYKSLYWQRSHAKLNVIATQVNELIKPDDFSCLTISIPPTVPPPEIA